LTTAERGLSRGRLAVVLTALLLGTLMTSLSTLVLTTALPVIIATLGGMELYSWAFGAALLTSTVMVPIAGKLSDLYGRRALYLSGMAMFLLGSALCGAARDIEQLIAFRALQGLGAGCVSPAVSALIADLFEPAQRGRWQGINGAIWGLSSVAGPILGGYLAEHVSWRWVFYVNLLPGLVAVGLMIRFMPRRESSQNRPLVDYGGIALLTGSLVSLLSLTVLAGKSFAWASLETALLVIIGVVGSLLLLAHERRVRDPIVPLALLAQRSYQTLVILSFLTGAAFFAAVTYVPLYLQAVFGISPTASGLLFAPTVAGTTLMSVVAGIYMHRIGYRRMTFLTMLLGAGGFALLAAAGPAHGLVPVVLGLSIIGSAIGVSFPVFIVYAQNVVEHAVVGVATSTIQVARTLGGTVGVAVLGAFMTARLSHLLIGGVPGRSELAALLRPEALAAMAPQQVSYLRAELTSVVQALFTVGALLLGGAVVLSTRLGDINPPPRRSRHR
jgi:EmrB/QacA subfamily drug resistance transporter